MAYVPTAIWTALVTSGGALFGVWLGNRNSQQQAQVQLKASAAEAERARLFDMRRNVILGAAEAVARANGILGMMPDVNVPEARISAAIAESSAAIAKVQLVATTDTIEAALAVQATLSESMASLWPGRWSLLERNRGLSELQRLIASHLADKDRWLELMKQHNARGDNDRTAFQRLEFQFNNAERLRVELVRQHAALLDTQLAELGDYLRACMEHAEAMIEVTKSAIVAARNELGMESSPDRLASILQRAAERTHRALEILIEQARQARERAQQPMAEAAER